MGFSWPYMKKIEEHGLIAERMRLLDIGSSNLYNADAESLKTFISTYDPEVDEDEADAVARRLAAGSTYEEGKGGSNEAFLGEVIEAAGMEYWSFDIADGYRTEILDFNTRSLPERHRNMWDLVINFGTTEHILNQANSFKIIHEATRVGGAMFHQLPSAGYTDHCYFIYTAQFFLDLAKANHYRVIDFFYGGPASTEDLNRSARVYRRHFPILNDYLASETAKRLDRVKIPDIFINFILQKVNDQAFVEG